MASAPDAHDPIWIVSEFQERRRQVLRRQGHVLGIAFVGLAVLGFAAGRDEAELGAAVLPVWVIALLTVLARTWWLARREWRCPDCDERFQATDVFAASLWSHCPHCGVAFRQDGPSPAVAEALRRTEGESHETLVERLKARRRMMGVGLVAVVLVAGVLWWLAGRHGLGEEREWIGVLAGGVATGLGLHAARCPRCERGIVAAGRCPTCGFEVEPA